MITFTDTQCEITIGDGDVLIGFTALSNVVRVWIAPLLNPLPLNDLIRVEDSKPPGHEILTLYFVNKNSLEGFIKGLQNCLEKM